ncbi:MAG TPA: glycosyltransferase [Methanomassiliicoccaceae archaeon]|nr:glycosyltransferase [Methanomassiliicoccaceae archaeon]
MGVPLLVSPRGGLPELVSGPCGLVADLTVEDLASALRMFEKEEAMRSSMASNALRRYEEVHTPERYIARYLKLAEEAT